MQERVPGDRRGRGGDTGGSRIFHGEIARYRGEAGLDFERAGWLGGTIEKVGYPMRRRLRKFLPIVLIALMVQILAPIGACWAASMAASDPLGAATICRDGEASTAGQADNSADQSGGHHIHDGACCLSCGSHVLASIDTPPAAVAMPYRYAVPVLWQTAALTLAAFRPGSHAQARAPPSIS